MFDQHHEPDLAGALARCEALESAFAELGKLHDVLAMKVAALETAKVTQ